MPTVELVEAGTATGEPHYLIFDPKACEPWVGNIRAIIDDVEIDLDATPIYLITTDHQIVPVHIESTDGDPDWLDWEVTTKEVRGVTANRQVVLDPGGELVERVELDGGNGGWESVTRTIHVNGF